MSIEPPRTAPTPSDTGTVLRRGIGLAVDVLATGAVGTVVAEGPEIGFHPEIYGP